MLCPQSQEELKYWSWPYFLEWETSMGIPQEIHFNFSLSLKIHFYVTFLHFQFVFLVYLERIEAALCYKFMYL